MSDFKPGDRVRCVKRDYYEESRASVGDVLVVKLQGPGSLAFRDTTGGLWLVAHFELIAFGAASPPWRRDMQATTRPRPFSSANPGHLRLSTDRYSPTWVSRP